MTELRKVFITDETSGETAYVTNNGLDVNVQDQSTVTLDSRMLQASGSPFTLNASTTAGATTFVATAATGLVAGDAIFFAEGNRSYTGEVSAATGGAPDTVTVRVPIPIVFTASAYVTKVLDDMSASSTGTIASPDIFVVANDGTVSIDVTRILLKMVTTSTPVLTDFGDIAGGLTNGCVLRKFNSANSNYQNIAHWKDNSDIAEYMYDMDILTALGVGNDGLKGRMSFGGQDKHGVVIRLEAGDKLQLLIQDDISALTSFRIMVQGHITDEI